MKHSLFWISNLINLLHILATLILQILAQDVQNEGRDELDWTIRIVLWSVWPALASNTSLGTNIVNIANTEQTADLCSLIFMRIRFSQCSKYSEVTLRDTEPSAANAITVNKQRNTINYQTYNLGTYLLGTETLNLLYYLIIWENYKHFLRS